MNDNKSGTVDVDFILTSGESVLVKDIDITVWDALRKSETEEHFKMSTANSSPFTKQFIWGENAGVKVKEIAGYKVLSRN